MPIDRPSEPPKPPDEPPRPPEGEKPEPEKRRFPDYLQPVDDRPEINEGLRRTTATHEGGKRPDGPGALDSDEQRTDENVRRPPDGALQPNYETGEGTLAGTRMADGAEYQQADRAGRLALLGEDQVAQALSDRGHLVRQMPEDDGAAALLRAELGLPDPPKPTKNPDLFVGSQDSGDWVDVYTPREPRPTQDPEVAAARAIKSALTKVSEGQAERIHISLDRPEQTLALDDFSNAWADDVYRQQLIDSSVYRRPTDGERFELRELAVHKDGRVLYLYPMEDTE